MMNRSASLLDTTIISGGFMRRLILFLSLTLMPCLLLFSTAIPDFSGTWIRDVNQSDSLATNLNGKTTPISADLVIRHSGTGLQIETRWDYRAPTTASYILDGSEHSSVDARGNTLTYRSSWDQNKLVINEAVNANSPFGRADVNTRTEWSLSDNSNTLTVTTITTLGLSPVSRKQIYHR